MPNETGTAFLVDPMGHAPEQLSAHEYQTVRSVLDIVRDETLEAVSDVMQWTITSIKDLKRPSLDALLLSILWHYANEKVDADGALLGHHQSDKIHWISRQERETLEQTLTAIRSDYWFAEWLALQVKTIATGTLPDDRYPSPLKIAASLVDCIQEHEQKMEAAREMVRMRPDLLFPAEQSAVPDLATAPELAQPGAMPPATARRARKQRKQASHA